ncbi:MAG: sulfatase, partial [Candidatus Lindowbacteria bacterium]|nr:sulfatase [Candidatus Lindowbacteria bacterium]
MFAGARKLIERYGRVRLAVVYPVPGKFSGYETFQVVKTLPAKRVSFQTPVREGSALEVGLIRTEDTSAHYDGFSGKFRFRVYLRKWPRNRVLVEATGEFPLNERVSFHIDSSKLPVGNRPHEIIYEIEKESTREAKGYEPYHDFDFLVPAVYDKRAPDDLNVMIVAFDTLRADHLGCYGYKRATSPNVDAFAKKGVLFTQAISQCPWTTPAFYSLFTSLYPSAHQNRMISRESRFFYDQDTFVDALKKEGYYTVGVTNGANVSSEFGFGKGFNRYIELTNTILEEGDANSLKWSTINDSSKIFDEAMEWLEQNAGARFFMFIHTLECHDPYTHTDFLSENSSGTLIEQRKAFYDWDIRYADANFGKLMQQLSSSGLMSNTIIVFLSDHGEDFYDHYREADVLPPNKENIFPQVSIVDHGHSLYEELVHVPLIFFIPNAKPAKATVE